MAKFSGPSVQPGTQPIISPGAKMQNLMEGFLRQQEAQEAPVSSSWRLGLSYLPRQRQRLPVKPRRLLRVLLRPFLRQKLTMLAIDVFQEAALAQEQRARERVPSLISEKLGVASFEDFRRETR